MSRTSNISEVIHLHQPTPLTFSSSLSLFHSLNISYLRGNLNENVFRHISEHFDVFQKYSVTLRILILFLVFGNVMKHTLSLCFIKNISN